MVGAAVYVLTGTIARDIAGPGIIVSFLLAGVVSFFSSLCYIEFGTRSPKAGSAYVYTYVSMGEFWAFVIGWTMLLENMIGAATMASAWSSHVDALLDGLLLKYMKEITPDYIHKILAMTGEMQEQLFAPCPNYIAFLVCIICSFWMGMGVKQSAIANSKMSSPYGFGGIIAGAATCFYAFVGFDSISNTSDEAKNPSISVPMATIYSTSIVPLGYLLVSATLIFLIPTSNIIPNAALPEAFSHIGMFWVKYVVTLGACCGMISSIFGSLYSLPRCMYAMAMDGLLFRFLRTINYRSQLPQTNLVISGLFCATIALWFDLKILIKFISIGTLLAYTIVNASVIILRYRPSFERTVAKPVLTPSSEISSTASDLTTSASEIINLAGTLKVQYSWLRPVFGNFEPGSVVTAAVFIYTVFCCALCILFQVSIEDLKSRIWWTVILAAFFLLIMGGCLLVIVAHHQNTSGLRFKVPLVPFIPALAILCNIEFMLQLSILAWLMLFVWMMIGMLIYFLYGIHHSKEGDSNSSYSILMSSTDAVKEKWCPISKSKLKGALTKRKSLSGDRSLIIDEEDSTE
ncbi:hypothetical protein NQ314_015399 [Rhamnusium bicolor]|uniref:Cationic amino acid transporter C-terminal domain-containing protein n=1 Tax=Rhamnusium bicolor TaxID=1586634 RepID=A0AAV8WZ24_9CUCU|nr:hypothetical protein NQ314_015399 [Rhamnusium bicolor]